MIPKRKGGPSGKSKPPTPQEHTAALSLLSAAHGSPLPPHGRGENGKERAAALRVIAEKAGVSLHALRRIAAGNRRLAPSVREKIENVCAPPLT